MADPLFLPPMLANPVEFDKIPFKCTGYVMEPKLDGWRCLTVVRNGQVKMFSRTGHEFQDKVPHLANQVRWLAGRTDLVLDGEIGYHDPNADSAWVIDFDATRRVLGSDVDVALVKQRAILEPMAYYAFDLLQLGTLGLWNEAARDRRHMLLDTFSHRGADFTELALVPQWSSWNEHQYIDFVNDGGEGMVLKNPHAFYHFGKRPANNWYKVKKFETMDVVIVDSTPGLGKYQDQIGAVWFSLYDSNGQIIKPYLGKCSGMDDATRADLTANWDKYVHTVMEIRHFGEAGKGTGGLRYPQFVRLRPDRDAKELVQS